MAAVDCYMTLVMSDSYLPGAMVLAHSLRDSGSQKSLCALVTMETLSVDVIDELKTMYELIPVPTIANPRPANLFLMNRADLLYAFTKIAIWRQTQFRKVLYLDADIVVIQNLDHLFDLDVNFAAAPDAGWPDAFNSGFMLVKPDMGEYHALYALAQSGDSFDGADQGLLNQYYEHKPWHRLSFLYNCTPNAEYQWEPAYRYHKANIKAAHFIGKNKPWFVGRHAAGGDGVYSELVGKWWSTYDRHYKQASAYIPNKSYVRSTAVQERVFGESLRDMYYGVPEDERLPPPAPTDVAPSIAIHEAPKHDEFLPLTGDDTQHEQFQKPSAIPQLVIQEPSPEPHHEAPVAPPPQQYHEPPHDRPMFQAPPMEWDATRSAPPHKSRPEAEHFPTHHYTFEEEKRSFRPPPQYPHPPQGMWYNIPEGNPQPEEPPKPIFPWEQRSIRSRATRVFAEDLPPTPPQERAQITSPPHSSWEESSGGIEQYLRNVMVNQRAREQAQREGVPPPPVDRRESLVITGFPSEANRPSLPVTPAPILTSSFWGEGGEAPEGHPRGASPVQGLPANLKMDQVEWVCPRCGFSSKDPVPFIQLQIPSASPESVSASPHQHSQHKHISSPPESSSSASKDVVQSAFPPPESGSKPQPAESSSLSPSPESSSTQPLRPPVPKRESSSSASAISAASTIVPAPVSPISKSEKMLSPKSQQKPEPMPKEKPNEKEPEKQPEKKKEPEKKKPVLPPPAWLTAAIIEENEPFSIPSASPSPEISTAMESTSSGGYIAT